MGKRRWRRWTLRIVGALLLLLLLAGAGGFLWLRTSLPQTAGEVSLPGLQASVEIRRDRYGVPTIRAESEHDAYFALGFVHAQDRLFQMDFTRRLAAGRLSEVLGERALDTDRLMRVLGFDARAKADYEALPEPVRAALDAYAAGVNAFLATRRGAWPPEFLALRYRPEPWQPSDSLLWGWAMTLPLSSNWTDEALRAALARKLSPAALESLWPTQPPPVGSADLGTPASWQAAMGDLSPLPAMPGASNNWVLAGKHSASGEPLLANDPHLDLSLPGYWYLVRIETPTLQVAGASAPSVPFLILGHNAKVAWGFTTTMADNQDLFLEKPAAGAPGFYLTPDGPKPFVTRDEVIKVRGEPDQILTVRETRHGPIISDIGRAKAAIAEPDEMVALGWACLAPGAQTPEAFWAMNHASDAAAFRAALDRFDCPVQNIVYADQDHIGFMAAGRVPVRKRLDHFSQLPVEGWTGDNDWTGLLPRNELPQSVDPVDGLLATANNDVRPPGYAPHLAARFDSPYRVNRIRELLSDPGRLYTPDDMTAIQMDMLSPAARALLPKLLPMLEDPGANRSIATLAARNLLSSWDYRMAPDLAQPTIFSAWMAILSQKLFKDELGDLYSSWAWWNMATIDRLLFGPDPAGRQWCDDPVTPAVEGCEGVVRSSFAEAIDLLAKRFGDKPAEWRWGRTHIAPFGHMLFRYVPVLSDLTGRPMVTGGADDTLDRGSPDMRRAPEAFPHLHGAGFRGVYDLADLDAARFVIAGGQSGNPLSPNYGDLLPLWRDGGTLSIVGDDAGGRLILKPAGP
ncbi:MAG TPA: penicillin acylase family protein [Hypericibacter adhaerens]|uniref:penicillin acylase family protein n=1 Tax=Hypericibacter adhaerens TaxID=2602016 RepID=UPI002C9D1761|nr:penicillin acylase family protein [Hypericibacter adhaerens]HWA46182.1 penicillin acylase family protein [Hypericibacter adhaerens]